MVVRNVVCIATDDQPPDSYDHMPYIASDPSGSWVTFDQSCNVCPLCLSSRVTMLTGQYARKLGLANSETGSNVTNAGLDASRMIGAALRRAGVFTAFIGKYINGDPWGDDTYAPAGWDFYRGARGSLYYDFSFVDEDGVNTGTYDAGEYRTDVEFDLAVDAINTADAHNRPFFVMLAPKAPHRDANGDHPVPSRHSDLSPEFTNSPAFNEADVSDKPTWLRERYPNPWHQAQLDKFETEHQQVLAQMRAVDEGMKTVVDRLTALGILDETVIMLWADNGFLFGEHRHLFGKGVPYEESVRLALKVRWPGVTSRTDPALVTHADAVATAVDVLGGQMPHALDGMSFRGLAEGTAPNWRDAILIERDVEPSGSYYSVGSYTALRTATHKYVEHENDAGATMDVGNDDVELYDLTTDPAELTNLAGTGLAVEQTLARKLARLRQEHG